MVARILNSYQETSNILADEHAHVDSTGQSPYQCVAIFRQPIKDIRGKGNV